jgi:hypothetical protein
MWTWRYLGKKAVKIGLVATLCKKLGLIACFFGYWGIFL